MLSEKCATELSKQDRKNTKWFGTWFTSLPESKQYRLISQRRTYREAALELALIYSEMGGIPRNVLGFLDTNQLCELKNKLPNDPILQSLVEYEIVNQVYSAYRSQLPDAEPQEDFASSLELSVFDPDIANEYCVHLDPEILAQLSFPTLEEMEIPQNGRHVWQVEKPLIKYLKSLVQQ